MEFEDTFVDEKLTSLGFKKEYLMDDAGVYVKYYGSEHDNPVEITCTYLEQNEELYLSNCHIHVTQPDGKVGTVRFIGAPSIRQNITALPQLIANPALVS